MFSPSINVDLEKLKESDEEKPAARTRRPAPRRATPGKKPARPAEPNK